MTPRKEATINVTIFTLTMFVITLMPSVFELFLSYELFQLVVTFYFFASVFLIYGTIRFFLNKEDHGSLASIGLDLDDKLVSHLSIGLLSGLGASMFVYMLALLFGGEIHYFEQINPEDIIGLVIITILVSFKEELAYRGYMLSRMEQISGVVPAVILSSTIFSLLHFSWWIPLGSVPLLPFILFVANLTMGGIVLACAYYWSSKRLWAPMGFHFMWNIVAYLMFPIYPREDVPSPEIFQIEWGVTTIIGFFFGAVILYILLKGPKRE